MPRPRHKVEQKSPVSYTLLEHVMAFGDKNSLDFVLRTLTLDWTTLFEKSVDQKLLLCLALSHPVNQGKSFVHFFKSGGFFGGRQLPVAISRRRPSRQSRPAETQSPPSAEAAPLGAGATQYYSQNYPFAKPRRLGKSEIFWVKRRNGNENRNCG